MEEGAECYIECYIYYIYYTRNIYTSNLEDACLNVQFFTKIHGTLPFALF